MSGMKVEWSLLYDCCLPAYMHASTQLVYPNCVHLCPCAPVNSLLL